MNTFAPLFSGLVESSIWDEPYHVRILFVSMLAIKDMDHVVRKNSFQLQKRANISIEEVEDALKVLAAPDTRRPGQEHEGRRIEKTEDGWLVLNGYFYEDQMRKISRRFYKARKEREYRRLKEASKGLPDGGARQRAAAEDRAAQAPIARPENDGRDESEEEPEGEE